MSGYRTRCVARNDYMRTSPVHLFGVLAVQINTLTFRPACLPHMRQTLDLSEPVQALEEGIIASKRRPIRRKNTDQRQWPRLRTRHLRQHRGAAEKRDELPPPHATP